MNVNIRRNNGIDLAKFLCAIMVVMIHVPPFGNQGDTGILSYLNFGLYNYLCRLAVPFFFICNGFFLFNKLDLSNIDFQILKSRIVKVLKLYIIWSAIYLPIKLIKNSNYQKGFFEFIKYYIKDFFTVGSYSHLWYIKALFVSLLIITLLLRLKVRPNVIFSLSALFYFIVLFDVSYYGIIQRIPFVSKLYTLYENILSSTMNGIFLGFFFVSLGMIISYKKIVPSKKKSLICFFVSMMFLLVETFMLKSLSISKTLDMTVFLVPSAFFFFCFFYQVNLSHGSFLQKLGTMSKLIFYIHLWIKYIVLKIFDIIPYDLSATPLCFIAVLLLSIFASIIIMILSDKEKFRFLKKIY